jgi:hypothetical protein
VLRSHQFFLKAIFGRLPHSSHPTSCVKRCLSSQRFFQPLRQVKAFSITVNILAKFLYCLNTDKGLPWSDIDGLHFLGQSDARFSLRRQHWFQRYGDMKSSDEGRRL